MSLLSISLRDGDWVKVRQILQHISHLQLGIDSTPTFAGFTLSKTCEVAAGLNILRVTGLQVDGTAMTGTLRGAYVDISNGSTAATGTIRAMELKARTEAPGDIGSDVNVLEGLSISADSKDHSVTTMRAAEFILDGSTGGTITEAVGLRIANNLQANKATTSYGLQIYRDSFDYTADIQLSGGGTIGGLSGVMQLSSAGLLEIADITATGTGTFANVVVENTSLPAGNSRAIKVNHRKAAAGGVLYGIDVDVRHDVSGSSSRVVALNLNAQISDGTFADSQRILDFYGTISGGSFTGIRGMQNAIYVSGSPTFSADLVGAWNSITVAATVDIGGDIIGQEFTISDYGATVTGDVYVLKFAGTGVDYGIWDSSGGDWVLDADNQKLLFGAGQNSSIYYDSTDLIIKSDELDTGSCIINGLTIDKDANLTTTGTAKTGNLGVGTDPNVLYNTYSRNLSPTANKVSIKGVQYLTGNTGKVTGGQFNACSIANAESDAVIQGLVATGQTYSGNTQDHTGDIEGIWGYGLHYGTGTVANVRGLHFSAYNYSTGTITDARAMDLQVINSNAGGTIDNGYATYIRTPLATGTITNNYGIYLENQTGAVEDNYAIYSEGGMSYHAGNFGIGKIPTVALDVTGAMKVSANADITGITTLGDGGTTNYAQFSAAGDLTFAGSAGFYPARLSTVVGSEPTPDTGELIMWHDSTNNKVYLKYNDTVEGSKKVELI